MEDRYLVVGLGNPGVEYSQTRHNAGFILTDRLAEQWRGVWRNEKKFRSRMLRAEVGGRKVLLAQPQTFMNLSGEAVGTLVKFYRLPLQQLLVVVDDADLPLGEIRLRPGGGNGGHHGLESIEQHLGSQGYARLRIGIGRKHERRDISGHVLGRLDRSELALMEKVLVRAVHQLECWLEQGLAKAMSLYNGVVSDSNNEGKQQ